MSYRPVRETDIPVGMPAKATVFDAFGKALATKGEPVRSFAEQQTLLGRESWVWDGGGDPEGVPFDAFATDSPIRIVEAIHDRLAAVSDNRRLPDNFADIIWDSAEAIRNACAIKPGATLAYLQFLSNPGSALLNAIHSAAICEVIGKKMHFDEDERQAVCSAALTMNWPIFPLQDRLSADGRAPTPDERLALANHPWEAAKIAKDQGVRDEVWLACLLHHHDVVEEDGAWTDGLTRQPKLLQSADRYVALVSARGHRPGRHPLEAVRQMIEAPLIYEPTFVQHWGDFLGEYPPGSYFWLGQSIVCVVGQKYDRIRVFRCDEDECSTEWIRPPLAEADSVVVGIQQKHKFAKSLVDLDENNS